MNVELYINKELIETDPTISFPLTKQFADLTSPSDIITEYSKQIKVPMSATNDRVLRNMKSLDSMSVWLGDVDPTRRLPFRLVYNNSDIMSGYCRVASIVRRGDSGYYNVVLYGELGRVFRELRRLTFDPEDTNGVLIGSPFADVNCIAPNILTGITSEKSMTSDRWHDIIGFVPNVARNKDFNNKSMEIGESTYRELTELLDRNTAFESTNVSSDSVVGDGLTAREMNELRSYAQLPFVYWPRFWKMLQNAAEQLTGYTWELDKDWFNEKNIPYYYNLVMMLKTLPTDMSATQKNDYRVAPPIGGIVYRNDLNKQLSFSYRLVKNGSNEMIPIADFSSSKFDMTKAKMARIDGTITLTISMPHRGANGAYLPIKFGPDTAFECRLSVMNDDKKAGTFPTDNQWQAFSHFWGGSQDALSQWRIGDYSYETQSTVTTLSIAPTSVNEGGKTVFKLTMPLNVLMTSANATDTKFWLRAILNFYKPQFVDQKGNAVSIQNININVSTTSDPLTVQVSNDIVRSDMPFNFYDLWDTSVKPFDVILNYCKMFRILIFKDDIKKTLKFVRQNNYFKVSNIIDWTDKVNLKKDFVIEPISFDYKTLLMNYQENEIGLNSAYEDKYGVKYGEITLNTYQEFTDKQKELFSQPMKNAIPFSPTYLNWNRLIRGDIARTISSDVFVACADSDGVVCDNFGALMIDGGVRNVDKSSGFVSYLELTDDTISQANTGSYCWGGRQVSITPAFLTKYHYLSDVYDKQCIDYTVPKEVYTVNKQEYSNAQGIYEKHWKRWLDEIHNRDCKKVTCYVNLTLTDWLNFQFNHFVRIDKQLYFVNKITDFDASGNNTCTQVELLRVTNLSNWTEQ